MKKIEVMLITLLAGFVIHSGRAAEQMTTDELKKMIIVTTDISIPRKAIAVALETKNEDVLIAAMDNPNWDIKSAAIEAIGKLPQKRAATVLALVLGMDRLWSHHSRGGEGEIAQEHFDGMIKKTVLKSCGIDASGSDFYKLDERRATIGALEAYVQN